MIPSVNLALIVILSLIVGGLISAIALYVAKTLKRMDPEEIYKREMEAILADDEDESGIYETTKKKSDKLGLWYDFWYKRMNSQFPDRYDKENPKRAGVDVILFYVAATILVSAFVGKPIAGSMISTMGVGVVAVVLSIQYNRRKEKVREQISGFLHALKANIQANTTPEIALMKITDQIPSPLGDELQPLKFQLLSDVSFVEALRDLSKKTSSEDLRFLCACMMQAASSGSSLEDQIDIIRETVIQKKKLTDKISEATRSANLSMWVASVVIPAMFIAVYIFDSRASEFWFVEPVSWGAFAAVVLLYGAGLFMTKKRVDAVKKLSN